MKASFNSGRDDNYKTSPLKTVMPVVSSFILFFIFHISFCTNRKVPLNFCKIRLCPLARKQSVLRFNTLFCPLEFCTYSNFTSTLLAVDMVQNSQALAATGGLSNSGGGKPEAKIEIHVVRKVGVPDRRLQVRRTVAPTAAAIHAFRP